MSKTGYGVGFVSKQQRFLQPSINAVKTGNAMVDLIYARASSSPGPGHYTPDLTTANDWGYRTLKNFNKITQKGSESKRSQNISHSKNPLKIGTTNYKNTHETMEQRVKALNSLAIDSGLDHDSYENNSKGGGRDTKTSFQSQGSIFKSRSSSNPHHQKMIYHDQRPLVIQPHYSQEMDNLIVSHHRMLIQRPITVSRNGNSPGEAIRGFSPGNSASQDLFFKRSNTASQSQLNGKPPLFQAKKMSSNSITRIYDTQTAQSNGQAHDFVVSLRQQNNAKKRMGRPPRLPLAALSINLRGNIDENHSNTLPPTPYSDTQKQWVQQINHVLDKKEGTLEKLLNKANNESGQNSVKSIGGISGGAIKISKRSADGQMRQVLTQSEGPQSNRSYLQGGGEQVFHAWN
ncbi:hypothetical protein FGO68_gene1992 [Halteria grandinella]|uniref:Uncharacterized protein n=1 Tax=Halteria grandinella TaxID=5974 RepID=A0A8J8NDP6_HALGN|nr:hypothetical protein FGO68_gene1992 [Halteria grandinella]